MQVCFFKWKRRLARADAGILCFVGTEGRIAVDRVNLVSYPDRILKEPLRPEDTRVYHANSHSGNFLDCVRTRRRPICDIETAHRSVSAVLLGGIALELHRSLKWNPQKEQFTDDDKANRMLSAAFRPPWQL